MYYVSVRYEVEICTKVELRKVWEGMYMKNGISGTLHIWSDVD